MPMKYRVTVQSHCFEIYEIEADSKRHAECIATNAIQDDTLWDDYPQLAHSSDEDWRVNGDLTEPV